MGVNQTAKILIALFAILGGVEANAACSSPSGQAGSRKYSTSTNKFQLCDGTTWTNFLEAATLSSCTKAGQLDFDTTLSAYKYCNGSNWVQVGALQCTISSGQMAYWGAIDGSSDFPGANAIYITEDGNRLVAIGRYARKVMVRDLTTYTRGVSSTISQLDDTYEITGKGNYVFAAARGNQNMVVIDIGTSVNASYVTRVQAPNSQMRHIWALALTEDKNHLITVSWGSGASSDKCYIHAIDVSNPSSPNIVGTMNYTDTSGSGGHIWCNNLVIKGDTALINFDNGVIAAIDISNPAAMSLRSQAVGTNTNGSEGMALSSDGNYLYTANFNSTARFHVWNVSNLNSISYVSSIHNETSFAGAGRLLTYSNYIIVSNELTNALTAVDVSNPTSPTVVDTLVDANLNGPTNMVPKENLLYVVGVTGSRVSMVNMGPSCGGSSTSYGVCTQAGEVQYHTDEKVLSYCDGSKRLEMARSL